MSNLTDKFAATLSGLFGLILTKSQEAIAQIVEVTVPHQSETVSRLSPTKVSPSEPTQTRSRLIVKPNFAIPQKKAELKFDMNNVMDRALQLSYRMSQRRKQHQMQFIAKHNLSKTIQVTSTQLLNEEDSSPPTTGRVVGKIRRLNPLDPLPIKQRILNTRLGKKQLIAHQKEFIQQSKKINETYHLKKFIAGFLLELGYEAVDRVEQKRSFFSYRIHQRRGSIQLKMAQFIQPKHSQSPTPLARDSRMTMMDRISVNVLDPVTLKTTRARQLSTSRLYDLKIQKTEGSASDDEKQKKDDGSGSEGNESQSNSSGSDGSDSNSQQSNSQNQSQSGSNASGSNSRKSSSALDSKAQRSKSSGSKSSQSSSDESKESQKKKEQPQQPAEIPAVITKPVPPIKVNSSQTKGIVLQPTMAKKRILK